jgi:hypothetical protein
MNQSEKNFLEKFLDVIPGLSGYREKDNRRTTDKRLREYLASRIDGAKKELEELKLSYTNQGKLTELDEIGYLERKLYKMADLLRFASYGYSGFFDQLKIKEEELDQIYNYDLKLLEMIESLEKCIKEKGENIKEIVSNLEKLIDERKQIFEKP